VVIFSWLQKAVVAELSFRKQFGHQYRSIPAKSLPDRRPAGYPSGDVTGI